MQLFILRHGEAEPYASSDPERALTERGVQQTRRVLAQSQAPLASVTQLLASPYRRAQQTASLAAENLLLPITTVDWLVPETPLPELAEQLRLLQRDYQRPLLVSHQPLVGNFINWLCGLPTGREVMGTSCLASVNTEVMEAACGELDWLRSPHHAG